MKTRRAFVAVDTSAGAPPLKDQAPSLVDALCAKTRSLGAVSALQAFDRIMLDAKVASKCHLSLGVTIAATSGDGARMALASPSPADHCHRHCRA